MRPAPGDVVVERPDVGHMAAIYSGPDVLRDDYVGRLSPGESALVLENANGNIRVVTSTGLVGWIAVWNLNSLEGEPCRS